MKQLLTWATVGLLTSALFDPLVAPMLDGNVHWLRDLAMLAGGVLGLYLLVRYRNEL